MEEEGKEEKEKNNGVLGDKTDGKNTLQGWVLDVQNLMTNCSCIKRELSNLFPLLLPFIDTKRPVPTLAFLQVKEK